MKWYRKKKNPPRGGMGVRGWLGLYYTDKQFEKMKKKILKRRMP